MSNTGNNWSSGVSGNSTWSPWDAQPSAQASSAAPSVVVPSSQPSQSEVFFDPFGSFSTEPAAVPVAQQVPSTISVAPVASQPAPVQNNPFGALMSDFAPPVQSNPAIVSSNPAPVTSMTFSSDFMDLLAGPPASSTSNDTQLTGITTALDDFFGTPAPSSSSTQSTQSTQSSQEASAAPAQTSSSQSTQSQSSSSTQPPSSQSPAQSSEPSAPAKRTREMPKAMTAEEKEKEDEILRSFELKGALEKLSQGLLGESWKPKWVTFKTNRFAYYEQKNDPRPKYYVYLDETEVGLPKSMTQSYDYHHAFQLVNERKGTTWYFRTPGTADLKRWTQAFAASIKHYQERNSEITIYERLLTLSCVRYRSVEQYRSFNFYTSKQSTGSYAIAACILIELLLRRCIDITVNENVILHNEVRYQGIGVLDDTLDLLSQKLRMQREFKLADFIPMLLCSSTFAFGDLSLDAPVLRCIDSAVRRGTLKRGQTAKDWHVANLTLEDDLIKTFHSLSRVSYGGTDVREHATLGICYTVMRALNKTELPVQDVLDRGKVFPDLQTRTQVEAALDAMAKNLGPFDKKQSIVLKTVYSQLVQFITGGGQYQPQQAR